MIFRYEKITSRMEGDEVREEIHINSSKYSHKLVTH